MKPQGFRWFLFLFRTYLKNNLSVHGSVAKRFEMLTYYVYAPLFHRFAPCSEPLNLEQLYLSLF